MRALLSASIAILLGSMLLVTRADADLWGHLRFGIDILETRAIPSVDPYSFTQDKPWVNHEWLSELQMAAAYRAAGLSGLLILKAVLLICAFMPVWAAYRQAHLVARVCVGGLLALGTIHMTAVARPQLWTFLCLAILVTLLASERRSRRRLIPPILMFWANCHGGWIVGLAVLTAWASAEAWSDRQQLPPSVVLVLLSAVATFINPYGLGLWRFMAETVPGARAIDEWQPLWTAPALNWVPWGLGLAATVWFTWRRSIPLSAALVLVLLAGGAARILRVESLFALTAALLLAPPIRRQWPASAGLGRPAGGRAGIRLLVAAGALAGAMVGATVVFQRAASCVAIFGPWAPDLEVMAALRRAKPAGRLVTPFNWGEYAIWHLGPAVRVSIDGRRETVYSDEHLRRHEAVVAGTEIGLALLDRWHPDYVWLPATSQSVRSWLVSRGYRIDVETDRSFLASRADRLPVGRPPTAVGRCFPG